MDWLGVEGFLTNYRGRGCRECRWGRRRRILPWPKSSGTSRFPGQCCELLEYNTDTVLLTGWAISSDSVRRTIQHRNVQMQMSKWLHAHRDQERFGIRLLSTTKDPVRPGASRYQMRHG